MDDFDDIWNSITGGANYGPGEQANTPWWSSDSQYDDFEDDWRAVTGGGYTMDEITRNTDVRDLYEASRQDPSILGVLGNLVRSAGTGVLDMAKRSFTKPDGSVDWRAVAGAAGGLYGLYQSRQPQEKTGYQGGIPKYEAVRAAVPGTPDSSRRPGSGGQRYFSDTRFVAPEGAEEARAAAQEQAAGLAALNRGETPTAAAVARAEESAAVQEAPPEQGYAQGGIAMLAKGGPPRYLDGATDGMADKIKANIDGEQEARLSHGEFVIPADVVSHIGNGNSEAGAERLYAMMDRIRDARTGTTKQGKQINPDKFLPA
jgi:hypothetical protein